MQGSNTIAAFQTAVKERKAMTVVTYGDSWTYGSVAEGWFAARDAGYDAELITGSWASMLRTALQRANPNARLINEGAGGWTAPQGNEAYEAKVALHKPDYLILNFGINDWKNGVALADYVAAMEGIIRKAASAGCRVVLWTSGPLSIAGGETYGWEQPWDDAALSYRYAEFTGALRALAESHDIPLADAAAEIEAIHRAGTDLSGWFYDNIHFKQEGHDRILHSLMRVLRLE